LDKQTLIEQVKKMGLARTCRPNLKRAVQKYLIALGKPGEELAAKNLISEIEESITPIDELVTFARSSKAIQILGKEDAKKLLAHVNELHASGAKYCDCPACKPAEVILQHKEILLDAKKPNKDLPDKQALIEKLKTIAASPSCYPDLRQEIENYLVALGTAGEKIAAEKLLDEIKRDIVPTEQMIIFAHSNSAIEYFGKEGAKKFLANAEALRQRGEKYCNCLACTLGLEVLEHKNILLANKETDTHAENKVHVTRTLDRLANKDIVIR